MGIKDFISIYSTKFIITVMKKLYNGGSNLPGKIALKISPNILGKVSKGYEVIFVTGTNGKTTTTSMIYNVLKKSGYKVITNGTGANMYTGVVTTFIENYKKGYNFAIIEIDEANLKFVTKHIKPKSIIITNLFKDQLDRYGEVYTTLLKILEGIKDEDIKLILNGDEPLLGDLNVKNEKKYFGLNLTNDGKVETNVEGKFCIKCKTPYTYNFVSYNHLGSYYCENCGYKRPELDYVVDDIVDMSDDKSVIIIEGHKFSLNMGGLYNIYNGINAYAVCREIGLSPSEIISSFEAQESVFGRQELLNIENHKVKIILVKNPAGFNEGINTLLIGDKDTSLGFILNDNYADGRDVSWIWDVDFEKISNIPFKNIIVGGIRKYDMGIRLKVAGFDLDKFQFVDNESQLIEGIKNCEDENICLLATYTAMINLKKYLYKNKYIKKLW